MFSPARLLAPAATALLLLGSGCGPVPTAAESKAEPVATRAEKKAPVVVDPTPASVETPERQQFLDLVRKHVQDPAGLEIIEWGNRSPAAAAGAPPATSAGAEPNVRRVKFRCRLIASHRAGPIMLDTLVIHYNNDDSIKIAYLVKAGGIWKPK